MLDRNVNFWVQNAEDGLGQTEGKKHIARGFVLVSTSNRHDPKWRCPKMYANKVNEKGMIGMAAECGKNLILVSWRHQFELIVLGSHVASSKASLDFGEKKKSPKNFTDCDIR